MLGSTMAFFAFAPVSYAPTSSRNGGADAETLATRSAHLSQIGDNTEIKYWINTHSFRITLQPHMAHSFT